MKLTYKLYKIELYSNYRLHIIVTDDLEEAATKFTKKIGAKIEQLEFTDALHVSKTNGNLESFLFFTPNVTMGTIAHEALHATHNLMDMIGARLSDNSEESYAYLLGYIVDKCIEVKNKYEEKK